MRYRLGNRQSAKGWQIVLDIFNEGERIQKGSGVYVKIPSHFDGEKVLKGDPNHALKNKRLERIRYEVEKLCQGVVLDLAGEVNAILKGIDYVKKERLFIEYFDEYMETKTKKTTKTCYEQTRKKLIAFAPKLTPRQLDYEWVCRFDKWLTSRGMSVNGKSIVLRNIRTVVNHCITNEVEMKYPFRRFKIKQEETIKRNLSSEQVMQLRYYDCEIFQTEYRDMFMLMFYLIGINAADLFQLTPKNIVNGRLEYIRRKTDKDNSSRRRIISIKIEPEAMEIIERYRGRKLLLSCCERYKDYHDYLQHMNNGLKRIGMTFKVGLKATGKPLFPDISSYWSRHSWASIASELDIPTDTIGRALGHAYTSVTDTYINFDRKKIDRANRMVIDAVTKSSGKCLLIAM